MFKVRGQISRLLSEPDNLTLEPPERLEQSLVRTLND